MRLHSQSVLKMIPVLHMILIKPRGAATVLMIEGIPVLNSLDCKLRAAECEKLAEGAANPRVQAIVRNIARTWTWLALEAEQTLKQSRPPLQLIDPNLSIPLHRRLRVLHLKPIRRAAGAIGLVLPLRHDAFQAKLASVAKTISPSSHSICSLKRMPGPRAGLENLNRAISGVGAARHVVGICAAHSPVT